MEWEILLTSEVEAFLDELYESDPVSHQLVNQAILVLERNGPAEGRPLVDTITASRVANLKELRPPSAGAARSGSCWSSIRGGRRSCSWRATSPGSGTSGIARQFPALSSSTTITWLSGGRRWACERCIALAGLWSPGACR